MLSWDNMLGPAYHFDADVAKRVAVAVAEASCTTCKQVPVMRMVNTLNACESGVTLHDLALQSLRARCRARPFPNASEVQLELLHQEEGSGASSTFEQRAVRGGDAGPDPYPSPSRTGVGVGHALLEDVHSALYVPRGHLTLALNFPVRGEQFHGCVDAAMVLEHEGQYSFHGPTPLHEQLHSIKYVACVAPSGLRDSRGLENEPAHYRLIAQMAAAVGHNHGGTLWGALTDGADRWRFYRMERAVEYPCDEFEFWEYGTCKGAKAGQGWGASPASPFSYRVRISPTLSVTGDTDGEATVVDYVLSMAHHDWEGCTGNLAQTLEREAWRDGLRDGWGGRDVRG